MCGIAGIIDFSSSAHRDELDPLCDGFAGALGHRGPDDVGRYHAGGVSLVQTRLSIIDLHTGHQPLVSEDGELALVVNGEIYNHVELRRSLERAGHRFRTQSDSECILHAYREYGTELFDALHGMFAFALHDLRRARVLLARDRLGIKPLFVTQHGGRLYFASELKALLAVLPSVPELDTGVLGCIVQNNFASGADTVFRGIERLLPGQAWILARETPTRCWSYWQPQPQAEVIRNENEAMEIFDVLARDVVQQHLRSDVPVGLFLSSGADSTSLLALVNEHGYGPLSAYTAGFPGTSVNNELAQAAAMAERFGAAHHRMALERQQVLGALPLAMWAADELMMDYASLPTLLLARQASSELKVVISGEGGDEVFAGYGRYRSGVAKRLMATVRGKALGGFRASPNFSGAAQAAFGPELARACWHAPVLKSWGSLPGGGSRMMKLQQVDLSGWLPDDLLVKADRMLMAFGLEGRVPYLDHRVVEFGLGLGDSLKVRGRTGKWFLKRWMSRLLPQERQFQELLFRPKSGFTVPLADWMDDAFLARLGELLPRQPVIQRFFRAEGVRKTLARQARHKDMTRAVWALLCLSVWHRVVFEHSMSRPALDMDPLQFLE